MKKSLLALLLASLLLLGASCTNDGDTKDTDSTDDTGTQNPLDAEATDTMPPDSSEKTDANVIYSNDIYSVTKLKDGTYNYVRNEEYGYISGIFADAFVLEYTDSFGTKHENLALIRKTDIGYSLYSPDENGDYRQLGPAARFIQVGNYVLADVSYSNNDVIYGPDLVGYTTSFDTLLDGNFVEYEFYPEPQMLDTLPDGAVLIDEYDSTFNKLKLYETNDAYYCSYDYLTVKLPIDKSYTNDNIGYQFCPRFYKISGEEIEFTEFEWLFTNDSAAPQLLGILKKDYSPRPDSILEYMGATVVHTSSHMYIFKDGKMLHIIDAPEQASVNIISNYLVYGEEFWSRYTVVKSDLTVLGEDCFDQFFALSDGNCIALHHEAAKYIVYSPDGNTVYTSPENQTVLQLGKESTLYYADGTYSEVGGEYALVKENGHLKLYEPYGTLLCDFGEISDKWSMHKMLGGYYSSKEGYPAGIYFVFQDDYDSNQDGYHMYEYYYSFETGEHGLIDNGYQDFAYAKPVLYLYPTEETDVTVTFEHPDRLTVDYPVYNDGWRVTASPDGTLTDARGREYYALYWEESSGSPYYRFTDGFCVKGEDSADFLEEKLAALGFTDKEANEFIIYWLPILESNEYNLIRFELTEEREASNALHIAPAPDSLLRVAMHIKALDAPIDIAEQRLPSFERNGFTAVEWGGCIH